MNTKPGVGQDGESNSNTPKSLSFYGSEKSPEIVRLSSDIQVFSPRLVVSSSL